MSGSVEKNCRIVIAELFHARRKASEIIRDTGYAPRTVYRIVSNLRDGKGREIQIQPLQAILINFSTRWRCSGYFRWIGQQAQSQSITLNLIQDLV